MDLLYSLSRERRKYNSRRHETSGLQLAVFDEIHSGHDDNGGVGQETYDVQNEEVEDSVKSNTDQECCLQRPFVVPEPEDCQRILQIGDDGQQSGNAQIVEQQSQNHTQCHQQPLNCSRRLTTDGGKIAQDADRILNCSAVAS